MNVVCESKGRNIEEGTSSVHTVPTRACVCIDRTQSARVCVDDRVTRAGDPITSRIVSLMHKGND